MSILVYFSGSSSVKYLTVNGSTTSPISIIKGSTITLYAESTSFYTKVREVYLNGNLYWEGSQGSLTLNIVINDTSTIRVEASGNSGGGES